MNKLLFIIGMRRSGTSILKELVEKHPEVNQILFEPHELFFVIQTIHIERYKKSQYHIDVINKYKGHEDKWFGAKIAVNAGIEAMNWRWLDDKFDNPKYIFIKRNPQKTYQSWCRVETSKRGLCQYGMYEVWWHHINRSFEHFVEENKNRGVIIQYEDLLLDADKELNNIWSLLDIERIKGFQKYIRKPKT
jgi:hypothetical protein